ncbi:fungal specific transcription factor domain-containing protein [Aspergillus mulundensis]|uniref:Transcription factor domain-containing protein n=1 Tax=Aspergillus mulundensis TaxID=1810919 RepID=A0A3D8SIA5_9EURO|nr:Uncharacterized protein DSM5745_02727 [Aspergillus mulundensis]RDW86085.1 Uncharacterized protein DSM5745_02727 [Aspergillus mulundensis]
MPATFAEVVASSAGLQLGMFVRDAGSWESFAPLTGRGGRGVLQTVTLNHPELSSGDILHLLAPSSLIRAVLNDWFTHIHPLAPVLHRRDFLTRFGENTADPIFTGLVVSILAATTATLRRKSFAEYHPITPGRCIGIIQSHGLLPADGPYSLDWCIAKYNLATASMAQRGMSDPFVHRMVGEAVTGTGYLLAHNLAQMGVMQGELLKRLWCLLEVTLMCGSSKSRNTDMIGQPLLGRLVLSSNSSYLPRPYSDEDLAVSPSTALPSSTSPSPSDKVTYVPGLTHLLSIFRTWDTCQTARSYRTPSQVLSTALADIQNTLDTLPPPLRWRGGLSRPAGATAGHDVQIANIFITSLYVRSNLLQEFGHPLGSKADSIVDQEAETQARSEHQSIVSDLLEVLCHLPRETLEANGYSLIPKIRDIGGAYLDVLSVHANGQGEIVVIEDEAKAKLEALLLQLGILDFRTS